MLGEVADARLLQILCRIGDTHHSSHEDACMSKSQDSQKETKKKPSKTLKEKRAEKKAKKEGRS